MGFGARTGTSPCCRQAIAPGLPFGLALELLDELNRTYTVSGGGATGVTLQLGVFVDDGSGAKTAVNKFRCHSCCLLSVTGERKRHGNGRGVAHCGQRRLAAHVQPGHESPSDPTRRRQPAQRSTTLAAATLPLCANDQLLPPPSLSQLTGTAAR